MTRKRRYILFAASLSACVCISLATVYLLPTPRVTKANFDRIEVGMTLREVEAILGGRPRVDLDSWDNKEGGNGLAWWFETDDWKGARVMVVFIDGKANDKSMLASSESSYDKIRRWLGISNAAANVPLPVILPLPPIRP